MFNTQIGFSPRIFTQPAPRFGGYGVGMQGPDDDELEAEITYLAEVIRNIPDANDPVRKGAEILKRNRSIVGIGIGNPTWLSANEDKRRKILKQIGETGRYY